MSVPAGYRSRSATLDDIDAVDRLFRGVDQALFGTAESSRVWVEESWRSDRVDLPTMTLLVFDADGALVASAELEAIDPAKEIGAFARVHPGHLGRGVGSAVLAWTETAAAALIHRDTSTPLHHSVAEVDEAACNLMTDRGYRHVRTEWHMRMDLPAGYEPGPAPPGVTIRPSVEGVDDVGIWETLDTAFRTHFGYQPVGLERWWDNTRRAGHHDPSLMLVAEHEGRIVGASYQYILTDDRIGWVGDLGVRPEMQGRGIGSALLRSALADLSRRGMRIAELNVDSQNDSGAVRLYRKVGMTIVREWLDYERSIAGLGPV
ncbi:MAG: GNAT family N-acetyltransferase [Actinomycetota bacterium]|nr:GNAT family N-acetyltransferase [Actinomycetota bacterium]